MPAQSIIEQARRAYGSGWQPTFVSRAPGRLELLGNHIDYNGGPVLAGAIDRTVTAWADRSAKDIETTSLLALDLGGGVDTIPTRNGLNVRSSGATSPVDYLSGILQALGEHGSPVRDGMQIVISGDVPIGFGMSSSAALCVALTQMLAASPLTGAEIVQVARRAEHLTGAPVGAMDQSASVAGGVILFDGATGSMTPLTPELGDHVFAVAHSGVHHALTQSSYPTRVEESQQALRALQAEAHQDIEHLASLDYAAWQSILNEHPSWLTHTLRNRIDHVVSETERVRQGVDAVQHQDWDRFGKLMVASGRSSALSYDISHPTVEELVEELNDRRGVLGARMMGGGEGGPALALVDSSAVPGLREALGKGFFQRHNLDPATSFEVCAFGPGASLTVAEGQVVQANNPNPHPPR